MCLYCFSCRHMHLCTMSIFNLCKFTSYSGSVIQLVSGGEIFLPLLQKSKGQQSRREIKVKALWKLFSSVNVDKIPNVRESL